MPKLDPVKEAENAKTVFARLSGQEPCLHVYLKLPGKKGAVARIWLGTLPYMTDPVKIAAECKRQWPVQYARGIKVLSH